MTWRRPVRREVRREVDSVDRDAWHEVEGEVEGAVRRSMPFTIGSLFSGIGGLELGLERAGLGPVVWQAEANPFCRRVLEKHWPGVRRYSDVRGVTADTAPTVDIIAGGFPCQDVSSAGKGAGLAGERSGLWFEFSRIVGEFRPRWVVVENVASGARRWVDAVCADLGQHGYEVLPVPLSAQDVGAPHIRRRIFVVAHTDGFAVGQQSGRCGRQGGAEAVHAGGAGASRSLAHTDRIAERKPHDKTSAECPGREARPAAGSSASNPHSHSQSAKPRDAEVGGVQGLAGHASAWATAPEFRGMDDGIPGRVDRLTALGNAVVPQCAEVIGHMIAARD